MTDQAATGTDGMGLGIIPLARKLVAQKPRRDRTIAVITKTVDENILADQSLPAIFTVINHTVLSKAGLVATARREGENYSLFALAAAGVAPAFSDSDRRLTLVLAGFISRNPLPTWSRTLI